MRSSAVASLSDADLLVGYLADDLGAGEELMRRFGVELRRQLGRQVPFDLSLSPDQRDEVLGWGLALYSRAAPRLAPYQPDRATLGTFLRPFLRTAARDVQASYTPPGETTRPRKTADGKVVKRRHTASLDERVQRGEATASHAEAIPLMADAYGAFKPGKGNLHGTEDAYRAVDDRLEAVELLSLARRTAPPQVAGALTHIYREGVSLAAAARAVGFEPTALRQSIDRWVDEQGLEHAA